MFDASGISSFLSSLGRRPQQGQQDFFDDPSAPGFNDGTSAFLQQQPPTTNQSPYLPTYASASYSPQPNQPYPYQPVPYYSPRGLRIARPAPQPRVRLPGPMSTRPVNPTYIAPGSGVGGVKG